MNAGNHNPLILGITFSLVLHLLGFGFLNVFSKGGDSKSGKKIEFVTAVFVRKGKPRPKHLLPRLARPKQSAPARRRVVVQRRKPPVRRRRRRRRRSVEDIIKQAQRRIQRFRRRNKKDERYDDATPIGVQDGNDDGTVSTRAQARLGSLYARMLRRKIDRRFKPPNTLSESKIKSYMSRVEVEMKIGRTGRLLRVRISRSSGNRTFDSVLLNAIRGAAPYPSPPGKIWRAVANGITITF